MDPVLLEELEVYLRFKDPTFAAVEAFIVTFNEVSRFPCGTYEGDVVLTFQAVLVTDGVSKTYMLSRYDGLKDSREGSTVQISGDQVYRHPDCGNPDLILAKSSVGACPGVYIIDVTANEGYENLYTNSPPYDCTCRNVDSSLCIDDPTRLGAMLATKCMNGGVCSVIDPINGECDCPVGWAGTNCKAVSSSVRCPSNFLEFNKKCYYFETNRTYTWSQSYASCTQLNSVLVSIHSDEENAFVFSNNGASTWIGFFRQFPGSPFEWVDESDKDFSNWADGEPNDRNGIESCGEFDPNIAPYSWNDAICSDLNGYVCVTDIDDCLPDPCENNATCVDEVGNYTCICEGGYEGKNCTIDIDDCLLNPCENNATCVDEVDNYTCICVDGYEGKNCEIDINECLLEPCDNDATCVDAVNNYTCSCMDGFEGRNCETDINECVLDPCDNDATCVDAVNSYTCSCVDGFEGRNCETDINDCLPKPCSNDATCVDAVNNYTCSCLDGFTGRNCETDINDCLLKPCDNNARCVDAVNNYSCICAEGFTGKDCEIDIDECSINNGGCAEICVNEIGGYQCMCDNGVRLNSDGKRVCVDQTAVTISICLDEDWDVVLDDFSHVETLELAESVEAEVIRVGLKNQDITDATIKIIEFFPCSIGLTLVIEANNRLGQVVIADIVSDISKALSLPDVTLSVQLAGETVDVGVKVPPETYFVDPENNQIDTAVTQTPCTYLEATGYCLNGGQCYDTNGGPVCSCINGYTGPNCSQEGATTNTDLGNILAIVIGTLFGLALLMLVVIVVCLKRSKDAGRQGKNRHLRNNIYKTYPDRFEDGNNRGFVPYSASPKTRYWWPIQRW